jgi:hypothetical protein
LWICERISGGGDGDVVDDAPETSDAAEVLGVVDAIIDMNMVVIVKGKGQIKNFEN